MAQQRQSVVTPERFASGMAWEQYLNHVKRNREKFGHNYRETVLMDEDVAVLRALVERPDGPARVLALAEDGLWFDGQGHARAGQAEGASTDGWTSRLAVGDDLVIGNPISPTGVAVPREVRLPASDWQQALAPGDPILDVHIAAGGGMTPQRCADSMLQALEFFPRYFPEKPFAGFACVSWILNPDIADFYTPQSNMALWQREVHLFPYPSDGRSGLFYVFGEDEVNVTTAPRRTSLQRAMLDHLSAGNPMRAGGMFMLKEDLRFFGSGFYRSHWPPSALALET